MTGRLIKGIVFSFSYFFQFRLTQISFPPPALAATSTCLWEEMQQSAQSQAGDREEEGMKRGGEINPT